VTHSQLAPLRPGELSTPPRPVRSATESPWRATTPASRLLTHDAAAVLPQRSRARQQAFCWPPASRGLRAPSDAQPGAQRIVKTQQAGRHRSSALSQGPSTSQVGQLGWTLPGGERARRAAGQIPGKRGHVAKYRTGQDRWCGECSPSGSWPLGLACHQRQAGRWDGWIAPQPPPSMLRRVATEEGDTPVEILEDPNT